MESKDVVVKVVSKFRLDTASTDFEYWQSQSYQARLEALEQIRREYLWKHDAEPRIQRVYQIVKR